MAKKSRPEWFIFIREFIKKIFRELKEGIIKFSPVKKVKFYWQDSFREYFAANDIKVCAENLVFDMDEISKEYVDFFIKMIPHWNTFRFERWAEPDKNLKDEYKKFLKNFKQPYPKILKINPYLFFNIYGLSRMKQKVFDKINNGDIIIDAGGMNGDTAVMFHKYFPHPEIHVYEPLSENIKIINKILENDSLNNKVVPIKKGLGKNTGTAEICFNTKETAEIVSIDEIYIGQEKRIGLIKSDTEGYETSIIEGAKEIIKRDKPVLLIAMYHTPKDFFELKDKIKEINPGYSFVIRRSEDIIPLADFVLIAY